MPVPKGKEGMRQTMGEYKRRTLHSGRGGPVVKSREQAIAIGMSQSGMSKRSKKRKGSRDRSRSGSR